MNINQPISISDSTVARSSRAALRSKALMILLMLTFFVGGLMQSAQAQVAPAGAPIGNQASASYIDTANPAVTLNSTSNTVVTTVSQVYSFTLTAPGAQTKPLNQQVCYPHTITNTGNGNDTFVLTAPVMSGGFNHVAPISYYLDADGNGVPDNGTAITTTTALSSAGPSSVFRFVVCANTPASGPAVGANGTITVTATSSAPSSPPTQSVADVTTIGNCSITLTKALSSTAPPGISPVSGGLSPNAGPLYVVLSYNNSGSIACNNVTINDPLPSGFVYVPTSGRWSNSGATVLGDGMGADPAGIVYTSPTTAVTGTVTGTIASVTGSTSGNLYFQVTIASNLAVGVTAATTNTATVTFTDSVTMTVSGPNSSNAVTYSVAQVPAVAFNGSNTLTGAAAADPVTVASTSPGQTIQWTNYVWNNGNAADTFDIQFIDGAGAVAGTSATFTGANCAPGNAAPACSFPAGTTFTMFRSDGVTTLIDNGGGSAPDTGLIPLVSAGTCPAPYIISGDNLRCGYAVVVRATIPPGLVLPVTGPHNIVLRATSAANNTVFDSVTNVLTAIVANTVDLTNNVSVVGGAGATDGLGAGTATIITTNTVAPSVTLTTTTRFQLYVNNTSSIASIYDLNGSFFSVPAGVAATPVNWTIQFKLDGGANNCSTVSGGNITSTGATPIAAGGSRLICAEVLIPPTNQGGVGRPTDSPPGTYVLNFAVQQQGNATVTDFKRDSITLGNARNVSISPNGNQNTSPGGSVTYQHTITNSGNVTETISFPGAFLTNNQVPGQAWTSAAYIDDGIGNVGVLNVGSDTTITNAVTFMLAPNSTQLIFVRVNAPAMTGSPPNVTTITATYNMLTISATDTTTLTSGLRLDKFQQLTACATPPAAPTITAGVPNGAWSNAAIPAGAGTAPGQCIAYLIVGFNTTANNINNITISDITPSNTRYHTACSPATLTSGPLFASGVPANATAGTVTAVSAAAPAGPADANAILLPGASVSLQFCVRIN